MTTQELIDSFYRFAMQQLANGEAQSIDDLYDQWRCEHFSAEEITENVAAVQAAIDDMNNGDAGREAGEVERELRQELGLPAVE